MSVITVGRSESAPRAVIKLPTSTLAMRSLDREQEVLAAFRADERLRGWCTVVPTVLAEGRVGCRPYLVEQMLPGLPASGPVYEEVSEALLASAASAIAELHRRTAAPTAVDGAMIERWVDAPARAIGGAGANGTGSAPIDRVTAELREALAGRTLPLSWVHGDFVLGNILASSDGEAVLGIVDWELAAPEDVPSIDLVSLLVSARVQRERKAVGQVVRDFVGGDRWTTFERALLDSADLDILDRELDSRTVVLLWWLRHVSGNLGKSIRYGRRGFWARWNIHAVLDAVEQR
jgi:aminoglycoside phosphotransferase (APT) family kinase protein